MQIKTNTNTCSMAWSGWLGASSTQVAQTAKGNFPSLEKSDTSEGYKTPQKNPIFYITYTDKKALCVCWRDNLKQIDATYRGK